MSNIKTSIKPVVKQNASINQCDGCRRGLPVNKNGNHYNPDGSYDFIGCTAKLYAVEKDWPEITNRSRRYARKFFKKARNYPAGTITIRVGVHTSNSIKDPSTGSQIFR